MSDQIFHAECEYFTGQSNKCRNDLEDELFEFMQHMTRISGDTKVFPRPPVQMPARRPSQDYHRKRMHSEYNDDDEEDYF